MSYYGFAVYYMYSMITCLKCRCGVKMNSKFGEVMHDVYIYFF